MTKKKSHSQILHSYTNLVARVKADEAFLTSFPDRPEPQHEPESIDDASLDDLNHLRDLIHLRDQLTMLKHRLPVTNSLVFTAPSNDILGTPYKQTDYNTIKELNTGSFSLSLKASVNQGLLKYELKVFDILQDLKGLNRVSETPLCHRRFHDNLLVQTILILGDVDLLKEAEWNRQRSRSSRSQEQHVLRNGILLFHSLSVSSKQPFFQNIMLTFMRTSKIRQTW